MAVNFHCVCVSLSLTHTQHLPETPDGRVVTTSPFLPQNCKLAAVAPMSLIDIRGTGGDILLMFVSGDYQ